MEVERSFFFFRRYLIIRIKVLENSGLRWKLLSFSWLRISRMKRRGLSSRRSAYPCILLSLNDIFPRKNRVCACYRTSVRLQVARVDWPSGRQFLPLRMLFQPIPAGVKTDAAQFGVTRADRSSRSPLWNGDRYTRHPFNIVNLTVRLTSSFEIRRDTRA